MRLKYLCLLFVFCCFGCKTVTPRSETETNSEVKKAIGLVAGALSGQSMSDDEVDVLVGQLRTDEQAQTAVQSITDSFKPENVQVKYCPIDGERYAPRIIQCPIHHVDLRFVD